MIRGTSVTGSRSCQDELRAIEEIADRRNELGGNISLDQELRVVRCVNEWIEQGHLPNDQLSRTEIRRIRLGQEYHSSTKVDRSPRFIQELIELRERRAAEFREGT